MADVIYFKFILMVSSAFAHAKDNNIIYIIIYYKKKLCQKIQILLL